MTRLSFQVVLCLLTITNATIALSKYNERLLKIKEILDGRSADAEADRVIDAKDTTISTVLDTTDGEITMNTPPTNIKVPTEKSRRKTRDTLAVENSSPDIPSMGDKMTGMTPSKRWIRKLFGPWNQLGGVPHHGNRWAQKHYGPWNRHERVPVPYHGNGWPRTHYGPWNRHGGVPHYGNEWPETHYGPWNRHGGVPHHGETWPRNPYGIWKRNNAVPSTSHGNLPESVESNEKTESGQDPDGTIEHAMGRDYGSGINWRPLGLWNKNERVAHHGDLKHYVPWNRHGGVHGNKISLKHYVPWNRHGEVPYYGSGWPRKTYGFHAPNTPERSKEDFQEVFESAENNEEVEPGQAATDLGQTIGGRYGAGNNGKQHGHQPDYENNRPRKPYGSWNRVASLSPLDDDHATAWPRMNYGLWKRYMSELYKSGYYWPRRHYGSWNGRVRLPHKGVSWPKKRYGAWNNRYDFEPDNQDSSVGGGLSEEVVSSSSEGKTTGSIPAHVDTDNVSNVHTGNEIDSKQKQNEQSYPIDEDQSNVQEENESSVNEEESEAVQVNDDGDDNNGQSEGAGHDYSAINWRPIGLMRNRYLYGIAPMSG